MYRSILLLFLALGPALAAPGLLKGNTPTLSAPSIVTQARALSVSDRMEAIVLLEDYLAQGKDKQLMAVVALEAGEQRRLNGDLEAARAHFQSVTKRWPEHPAKDAALLGSALAAHDNARGQDALACACECPLRIAAVHPCSMPDRRPPPRRR